MGIYSTNQNFFMHAKLGSFLCVIFTFVRSQVHLLLRTEFNFVYTVDILLLWSATSKGDKLLQ